jgi:hypothetical protein
MSAIIKNKKKYERDAYKWLPDPNKGIEDEKKLLGVCKEKEGTRMFAIAPKCYYIDAKNGTQKETMKIKGVSISRNDIKENDYTTCLFDNKTIKGKNCGFYIKDVNGEKVVVKMETEKDAITPTHNKMICLSNYSCAPFIDGMKREDYIVKDLIF